MNNTNTSDSLRQALSRLTSLLPQDVADTLRSPASDAQLRVLSTRCLADQAVPPDLKALLQWHDGQAWNSPLSPENNRRLLSGAEIVDAWAFFEDPMADYLEPWQRSWLPVLTNDAGDYVVYETAGPDRGSLLSYWHDDASRSVEYASLEDWVNALASELNHPD